MTIAKDEIFGPVLSVIRVKTLEEAIELVNTLALWQRDFDFHRQRKGGARLFGARRSRHGGDQRRRGRAHGLLPVRGLEEFLLRRSARAWQRRCHVLHRAESAHDPVVLDGDGTANRSTSLYGGAQLFKAETPARLGALALELIRNYTPDASSFAQCLGLPPGELANSVFERTVAKLEREPVEDFRIDFEDGYGYRSDAEEDGHAVSTAQLLARGAGKPGFPPFIGIRIKPFTEALRARSARTLDLFLTALFEESSSSSQQFRGHAAEDHGARTSDGASRVAR